MRRSLLACVLALVPMLSLAQEGAPRPDPQSPVGENLQVPPDWSVRLDKPDPAFELTADGKGAGKSAIYFVSMTPGWHITTGPRAIFYHPGSSASGDFHAESQIHLFDPGERREAFGIFFGGRDLDTDSLEYDYFLLRNSGEFLIKSRRGDETSVIRDWTPHDSIVTYGPETEGTATNVLGITVAGDSVRFLVNGETVAEVARDEVSTDGLLGFRVNHHLNLHISTLTVE